VAVPISLCESVVSQTKRTTFAKIHTFRLLKILFHGIAAKQHRLRGHMRVIKGLYFLFLGSLFQALAFATPNPLPPVTGQTAGTIAGSFNVSDMGSANYSIPIAMLPGTAGVEPKLSLVYDSHAGNSLLGVGWSLSGLSQVMRCPNTIAQDGVVKGIDFSATDKFCLDGQRLVAINGTYGAHLTEYRTESDSFSQVIYNQSTGWNVRTKDGLRYEFGNSADSKVEAQGRSDVLFWRVNKISDTNGNYIAFSYFEDNAIGESYPTRIDYTGNQAQSILPYSSVRFTYEARPDAAPKYIIGSKVSLTKRLSSIALYAQENLVRRYDLTYEETTAAQFSRLIAVNECDSQNNCLAPTSFEWQAEGQFGKFDKAYEQTGAMFGVTDYFWKASVSENIAVDFDGDGLTDILQIHYTGYRYQALRSRGDGSYELAYAQTDAMFGVTDYFWKAELSQNIPIDFNGDGLTDILQIHKLNYRYQALQSRGDGSFELIHAQTDASFGVTDYMWRADLAETIPVDFNGDGLTDILQIHNQNYKYQALQSRGDGSFELIHEQTTASFGVTDYMWHAGIGETIPVDFNGDGLTDILQIHNLSYKYQALQSRGDGSFELIHEQTTASFGVTDYMWRAELAETLAVDFNGDGLTDILQILKSDYRYQALQSRGDGSFEVIHEQTTASFGVTDYMWRAEIAKTFATDFNGDGLTDILQIGTTGYKYHALLSRGDGSFEEVYEQTPAMFGVTDYMWQATLSENLAVDFNGDGLTDILQIHLNNYAYQALSASADSSHAIESVSDGHGVTTAIEYKPLSDNSIYLKDSDAVFPVVDLQGPMYVVSKYEGTDGVGGLHPVSYGYRGLKVELNGRGMSGFHSVKKIDGVTGVSTTTFYRQDYPFKTAIARTETRLANNTLIHETDFTWDVKYLNGNKTHFPFIEQSVTAEYEINGLIVKGSITDNEHDDFGNLTKQVLTFSDGSNTRTTENTYYNDTTNWFLGRLASAQVTTETGAIDEVRVSAFEYSSTTGLLTKEIVEPGHPTLSLTKVYQHDGFGNIRFSTLSGPAIASRTSETIYSSDGRFAVEEVNALNQSVFKEYDPQSGLLISSTDANGLEAQKEYDSFGRLTHEYFPDGTERRTVYYLANGQGPANAVYYIRTDASGQQPIIKYFDVLSREIRTEAVAFDGSKIFVDKIYNNRGEIVAISESYFENAPTVYWTTIQYDVLGRNIQMTQPNGGVTSTVYKEAQGQYIPREITNALNQKRTEYYDAQEILRVVEDDLGHTVTYMYDQGSGNGITRALDNVGTVLVLNKYDVCGNRIETTEANSGKTTFVYNALAQIVSQTDAKNQTVSFEYDLLGRLVEKTEPEGVTSWEFDTAPHGVGLLAAVVGINGYEEHYSYDALSRPYQTDTLVDGKSFSRSQSFDAYGRVQDVVYPYGFTVRNNYSSLGFLESITRLDTSLTLWTLNEATARGQMQKYTLGNGLVTQVAFYPATGLPQTIETGPAGIIQDLGFSFDALGNLQTRSDSNNNLAESFYYDSLNRLTDTQIAGGYSTHLTYNDNGNISYKSDVGTYTYGQNGAGLHAVTSIVGPKANTYTYDAVGNRLTSASDAGQVFYTSFNKPRKIKKGTTATVEYVYGPNQEKLIEIKTKSSLKETKYFIGTLYEHIEQARVIPGQGPKIVKHYNIYAGNHLIATIEEESPNIERTRYLHKDHLGSTQTVTDANGVVKEVLSYDAWGQRRNVDGTPAAQPIMSEIDQGFTGHEQIDEVGLIHMGGRVYDPIIGRFLSADPFVQAPENLQALNRYSYVLNNPLSAIDPSGFFFKKLFKALLKPFQPILKNEILSTVFTIALAMVPGGQYWAAAFQAANTYANGGSFLDGLKAAAISYAQSYAFEQVGGHYEGKNIEFGSYLHVEKIIAHGAVGGTASALQGGKFQHGFMSGAAAQFFAPAITENFQGADLKPVRVALSATVGGTASVMTGGKFANGAITGAFSRLFNDEGIHKSEEKNLGDVIYDGLGWIGTKVDEIGAGQTPLSMGFQAISVGFGVSAGLGKVAAILLNIEAQTWRMVGTYSSISAMSQTLAIISAPQPQFGSALNFGVSELTSTFVTAYAPPIVRGYYGLHSAYDSYQQGTKIDF
jgi:RHS repeat-associated protein